MIRPHHSRQKLHLNPYKVKSRYRRTEWRRGIFKKKRTLKSPKIYLPTQHIPTKDASAGIQRQIFLFLFILGIGAFFYLLFFFPFWEIHEIAIVGHEKVAEIKVREEVSRELEGRVFHLFPKKNLIITSKAAIAANIQERFAQVESVSVAKEFPNVLKITLQEKEPVAIWASGATRDLFLPPEAFQADTAPQDASGEGAVTTPQQNFTPLPYPANNPEMIYYYLNLDGTLGDRVAVEEILGQNLPIIYNQSFQAVAPRQHLVTPQFLNFMGVIRDLLPLKTNLKISAFIVPVINARDLYIKTDQGYQLFFDTEQNIQNQVNALQTVLREDVEKGGKRIQYYVDLRVEGLVFYK